MLKKRKSAMCGKSFLLILACWFCFPPFVKGSDNISGLSTLIVTAEKPLWQIPSHIEVITADEIGISNAQTVADIIKFNSGTGVYDWMGNSSKVNVDAAGFGETGSLNILVLVDGRRINEIDMSGADWLQIPVERVEKIEIIRNSQSARYGDNASGGVINIITKTPSEKKLNIGYAFGYHGNKSYKCSVENRAGNTSYAVNGSLSSENGYRDNNSLSKKDIGLTIITGESAKLTMESGVHSDKYDMPGGLWTNEYETNRRQGKAGDSSDTNDGYVRIGAKKEILPGLVSQTAASYRLRKLNTIYGADSYDNRIPTLNITEQITFSKPAFGMQNIFSAGVEFFSSNFNQDGFENNIFKRNTSTEKTSRGLFLSNEIFFTDAIAMTASARGEICDFNLATSSPTVSETTDSHTEKTDVFSVGLSYRVSEKTNLYFSFAQGYRMPNTDEFKTFDPISYAATGINKSLESQKSEELQTGIRKTFRENIQASLSVFSKNVKKEIFLNPLTGANENYPSVSRRGADLNLKLKLRSAVTLDFNYKYLNAVLSESKSFTYYDYTVRNYMPGTYAKGNEIPGVARHKISASAGIGLGQSANLHLTANYTGKRYLISDWQNVSPKMPAFTAANVNFNFRKAQMNFFAGVNNIFNRKYSEYGTYSGRSFLGYEPYYYPAPERSFSGGVSMAF